MKKRRFHSCYVVDVTEEPEYNRIRLTDSTRNSWFVCTTDTESSEGFKTWLKNVFLKGVSNTLTVFEYEDRGEDAEIDYYIMKFFCLENNMSIING